MGSIRALLAISVLMVHSGDLFGFYLLNGDMAITCFFTISGFLMALILEEKYTNVRVFYLNRLLRIYPAYWVALLLSAAIFWFWQTDQYEQWSRLYRMFAKDDWLGVIWSAVSNLTLVGIDWIGYTAIDDGVLVLPAYLYPQSAGAHNILFVPQAWTLALELQYYLLAPFVARWRTRTILLVALAAMVARLQFDAWMKSEGIDLDGHGLIPLQVHYFLMGALAYRLYAWLRSNELGRGLLSRLGLPGIGAGLLFVVFGYTVLHKQGILSTNQFHMVFALFIPFFFHASRSWKWDKTIGEFSYPIYLFHVAVSSQVLPRLPEDWWGEVTLIGTVAVSAVYIYLIDIPLQRARSRVAKQGTVSSEDAVGVDALGEPARKYT